LFETQDAEEYRDLEIQD